MIPPSTTITERGRRIRRTLLWAAVGIVALNVAVVLVDDLASQGRVSGPAGSTYVTTADGAAALAGTVERLGVDTARLRAPLDEAMLTSGDTLAVIEVGDAAYSPTEISAIADFVEGGGRLVVAGQAGLIGALLPGAPEWRSEGAQQGRVDVDGAEVGQVALGGFGSFDDTAEGVLVGDDGTVVGVARALGSGLVVWVADPAPFSNEYVGRGDTAAALVGLLGPDRRVLFDEYRHGYSDDGGLWSIIPAGWKTALILGAVTLVVALVAYGRRFGPPQDERRRLKPARSAYLESVAAMMGRGGGTADAVAVIRGEARRVLERRSGVDGDVEATARRAGLDTDAVGAVLGESTDEETLVNVDRALAALNEERR